ncbi:hypothetical protein BGX30_003080, partial [Mortierella sp. GBA39]
QGGRPKVPTIGAGLAGLTLGMLLHKASIPFEIYEQATIVKPHANLFRQCGIYDELVSLGKYVSSIKMCSEGRETRPLTPEELPDVAQEESQLHNFIATDKMYSLNPAGGVGAANAMHDVVELANRISSLPFHPTVNDIEDAFKAYKSERIGWVTNAFENSKVFVSTSSNITRFLVKHTPQWVMLKIEWRQFIHRPQVAFLPLHEYKGSVSTTPQASLAIKIPVEAESSTMTQAF